MENVRLKNQYVMLTGSKSNAGDFLIKYRAKRLLEKLRPDRTIVDYDGWKPLTDEQLKTINESKALLLTGGPSVQKNMYPNIYALTKNLDDIKVPIIAFGVGWKSHSLDAVSNYALSDSSLSLLKRINSSGYSSSVRDVPTCQMLENKKFGSFTTTGCPALYDLNVLEKPIPKEYSINKIAFSTGVAFVKSLSMDKQAKDLLLELKKIYPNKQIEVAFHHPIEHKKGEKSWTEEDFNQKHLELKSWLEENGFNCVDVSGSAEKLIEYYSDADLHIGYRVHAHIFMVSQNKPSILISEDSRSLSLKTVIGGTIVQGHYASDNLLVKLFKRIFRQPTISASSNTVSEIKHILTEKDLLSSKTTDSLARRNNFFLSMKKFIETLP